MDYAHFNECVDIIAADNHYVPSVIASILVQDMLWYAKNDGFNRDRTNHGQCENSKDGNNRLLAKKSILFCSSREKVF